VHQTRIISHHKCERMQQVQLELQYLNILILIISFCYGR